MFMGVDIDGVLVVSIGCRPRNSEKMWDNLDRKGDGGRSKIGSGEKSGVDVSE